MNNEYTPSANTEEKFHIKETTGGTYKNIKMIMLKSSSTGLNEKLEIANEFNIDAKKKDAFKSEYGVEEFYEKICKEIFLEKADFKFKDILIHEVNRAVADFFSVGMNNTPSSSNGQKS